MSLVPGYTPATNSEQFTWPKFLLAFTNGSANIANQSEITPGVITVSTSAPSGKTGDAWFDTSLGSGYGTLRIFDGSDWKPVAEGCIAQNKTGLSVAVGCPLRHDATITTALVGSRIPVVRTTSQLNRMLGVAATEMANDEIGIVLTRGKVKIAKDAANITAGDPVVPSATAAQATTNSVGSWGVPFGSSSAGFWLESSTASAGTLVTAYLTGHTGASWVAYKNSGGTVVYNNVAPSSYGAWQGTATFATAPANTVAHICQIRVRNTAASANHSIAFGLRMANATVNIDTGAAFASGDFHSDAGVATDNLAFRATLIVQETTATSGNVLQYYINSSAGVATALVHVIETGVIVGGQVV